METIKRFRLGRRSELITLWAHGPEFAGNRHLLFDFGRHLYFARWGFYVWIWRYYVHVSLGEPLPDDLSTIPLPAHMQRTPTV